MHIYTYVYIYMHMYLEEYMHGIYICAYIFHILGMIALQPWEPLSRFQTHHGDCSRAQDLLGLQGTFPSMKTVR